MELKISIPWGDGTNQYFYLDFSKIQENDQVLVTSDKNTQGIQRVKVIGFKGISEKVDNNQPIAYLQVLQQTDNSVVATFDNKKSLYSNTSSQYVKQS
jgi:hypothetical protein